MTIHANTILTIFITWIACSYIKNEHKSNPSSDTARAELSSQEITSATADNRYVQTDSLPIHGELDQRQIELYYPGITDTIEDRRIFGSEQIDIQTTADIYVSMLHNTGTFDQMFLCTHDNDFNLLNSYYIGTSTMFDKTSHTIEYMRIGEHAIEFRHVDWGYANKNGDDEIDTLKYEKYILVVKDSGRIVKK